MTEKSQTKAQDLHKQTASLEKWLDETVNKKQPLQLPAEVRKWLADNVWWLSLIGGVLSLWGAYSFWQVGHYLNGLNQWAYELGRAYGAQTPSNDLGVMWYVALVVLVIQGVLLLLAVPKLKVHQKSGWNLLFYTTLLSLVLGVIYLFVPGYGIGSLLGTLIGTAIGWFFLFQIRSHFVKK